MIENGTDSVSCRNSLCWSSKSLVARNIFCEISRAGPTTSQHWCFPREQHGRPMDRSGSRHCGGDGELWRSRLFQADSDESVFFIPCHPAFTSLILTGFIVQFPSHWFRRVGGVGESGIHDGMTPASPLRLIIRENPRRNLEKKLWLNQLHELCLCMTKNTRETPGHVFVEVCIDAMMSTSFATTA